MTSAPQIVIIPIDALDPTRIEKLTRTGSFELCYLGSSFSRFTQLREHLPSGWSMPVAGPRLNAATKRLRDAVINLDAQAQLRTLSRLQWDASLLAERGPFASTLELNLARLVVFVELAASPGRYLVVVDDVAFGRLLLHEAIRRKLDVGWLAPGSDLNFWQRAIAVRHVLGQFVDGARRRASVVRRFLVRKLQLVWLRRRRPLRLAELRRIEALLVVWGRADTFPKRGPLVHEFNFGRLPELLRQAGLVIAYLAYPLTYVSPFGAIASNALDAEEPVALVEDFIPWWAVIPAALSGLGFPRQVGRLSVLGIDATDVLRLEARRDRRLSASAEARLLSYLGSGLARRGIRPKLLLHLYESQPWEKMLAFGVRRYLPSTRIVGVQHAPFAWNYLSFFPSRRSVAEGAVPDLLLAAGEGYAEWFREAGIPPSRIGVLGAVRYAHAARSVTPRGRAVLCCTSIELEEAIELGIKAAAAMQGLGIPLIINFHPVTDEAFRGSVRDAVRKAVGGRSDFVTFSLASMRDLLEQAGCVLYMSSAACFEAVEAGRVAVYVARDFALDYDKLPDDMARRCQSGDALRETLRTFNGASYGNQTNTALTQWLGPVVDADTLRRLLTSPCDASSLPQAGGNRDRARAEPAAAARSGA